MVAVAIADGGGSRLEIEAVLIGIVGKTRERSCRVDWIGTRRELASARKCKKIKWIDALQIAVAIIAGLCLVAFPGPEGATDCILIIVGVVTAQ